MDPWAWSYPWLGALILAGLIWYAKAYSRAHPNCHHPQYCQRRGRPRGM